MTNTNKNPLARYESRPLTEWAELTPATVIVGTRVRWTDARGRVCVGLIANAFPGYVAATYLSIEGVPFESVCSLSMGYVRWPNGRSYSGLELREAAAEHPRFPK